MFYQISKKLLKILKTLLYTPYAYLNFIADFYKFKRLMSYKDKPRFFLSWRNQYPCLSDKTSQTVFDRHYVYHTAWAARVLAEVKPDYHTDISSLIYFSSLVSAFIPIKFYDYRPANLQLSGLVSEAVNLLELPFTDNSIPSLSCMHVVEHIGLGRYGDPLDPDADLKAISELKRVLKVGGSLLFVVPIGNPKIMFNAHRIYSYESVIHQFRDFELKEFSLIPDHVEDGNLIRHASKVMADIQTYGCGCFWFQK